MLLGDLTPTSIESIYTMSLKFVKLFLIIMELGGIISYNQSFPLNIYMKTKIITCNNCGTDFEKRTAEYNRQLKNNPNYKFYCTMTCHGKINASHLRGMNSFSDNPDLHARALTKASLMNTRYIGDEKVYAKLIRKCKQRNREFDLTIDFLKQLWDSQNGHCAISNIQLDLHSTSYIVMPSVDRIDSSVGYIKGNVQFVSCAINLAKANMSNTDALILMKLIHDNYKKE